MTVKQMFRACVIAFGVLIATNQVVAQSTEAATDQTPVLMAVMDLDGVFNSSKAAKSINEQIAKHQAYLKNGVETEMKALQDQEKELQRQRTLLEQQVFTEKRNQLQAKFVAIQRRAQEVNQKVNQARAKATNQVLKELEAVVKEIADKNQIGIIFRANMIVSANPALDISDTVLAELDKRLPSVQVEDPTKK